MKLEQSLISKSQLQRFRERTVRPNSLGQYIVIFDQTMPSANASRHATPGNLFKGCVTGHILEHTHKIKSEALEIQNNKQYSVDFGFPIVQSIYLVI